MYISFSCAFCLICALSNVGSSRDKDSTSARSQIAELVQRTAMDLAPCVKSERTENEGTNEPLGG